MIEIEMKFPVDDEKSLRLKLVGLQAVAEPIEQHVDSYYRHPCRDFAATGEALRIRRVNGRPSVTYKGPKEASGAAGGDDGDGGDRGNDDGVKGEPRKIRRELEWSLAPGDRDGDKMAALLVHLGFSMVAEVPKRREPFEVLYGGRRVTVTIDHVEGLGTFAEVECMAESEADRDVASRMVGDVAARLGLSNAEPRSYLRMKLEREASEN